MRLGATLFEPDLLGAIYAEAGAAARELPPRGALDRDDVVAIALVAAWEARQRRPEAGGGYVRVRVRGELRDALRRERRALGRGPAPMLWPWFRARIGPPRPHRSRACRDCPATLDSPCARRCPACQRQRRRARDRARYHAVHYGAT